MTKKCVVKYDRPKRRYKTDDLWRIYCNHLTENEQFRFRLEFTSGTCESHDLGRGRNILNRVVSQADVHKQEITLLGNLQPLLDDSFEKMRGNVVKFAKELEARNKILDKVYEASILQNSKSNITAKQREVLEKELQGMVKDLFESQAKGSFVIWKLSKITPTTKELFKDIQSIADGLKRLSTILEGSGNDGMITNGIDLVVKILELIGRKRNG